MKILTLIIALIILFFSNLSISAQEHDKKPREKKYTVSSVEVMPTYDMEELQKNIVYPEKARKKGIEGTVMVRAKINKYGKVVETKIAHSDSKLLNNAAIDAIKMTKFTPARNGDEPAEVWITLPIKFKLK